MLGPYDTLPLFLSRLLSVQVILEVSDYECLILSVLFVVELLLDL